MNNSKLRKRKITTVILAVMVLFAVNSFAQFGGGDGSEGNPWVIETAEHLNNIRDYPGTAHSDKHFILRADIDLGTAPWNAEQGWTPIGPTVANGFHGHLDGNGHVIKNLTIDRSTGNYQGLFGYVGGESVIKNLGLLDVDIVGGQYIGAIAGYNEGRRKIERCYATGRVEGLNYVGGIVGRQGRGTNDTASILDSYSNVLVVAREGASRYAGGIVAYQYRGETHRCYAAGLVEIPSTSNNAGAVIGNRAGGNVSNIYWDKDYSGLNNGVGNLAGQYPGSGIVQLLQRDTYDGFDFDDVWNIEAGTSYAYLRWQGEQPEEHNMPGLLPPRNIDFTSGNRVVNLTWQSPPEEIGAPDGYNVYRDQDRVNPQPIEERQYRDEEVEGWAIYTYYVTAVYGDRESSPSASVAVSPLGFAGGEGTVESPYQIAAAIQLDGVRRVLDGHFIQTADIDLDIEPWNEGQGWTPLSNNTNQFRGTYNGNGYAIKGLTINRNSTYQGLFGYGNEATVIGVRLEDVNMTGGRYAGALLSYAVNTNFTNCSVSGYVKGTYQVGGLSGYVDGGAITRCYVVGEVVGTQTTGYIGGIAGQTANNTNITNCYSTAIVQGYSTRIGGLVGQKHGEISNSYCTGAIFVTNEADHIGGLVGQDLDGTVTNSFWNIEITSRDTSAGGGTGSNTPAMVRRETFEEADWDFPDIWNIVDGETYPYLAWEEGPSYHNRPGPFGLTVVGDHEEREIALRWNMIGNPDYYNIYRDNVLVGSVDHPIREKVDTDLDLFVRYNYYVEAVFSEGEDEIISASSNHAEIFFCPPFAGGDGSPDSPYQVALESHLDMVRYFSDAHFIQTAHLDLQREAWVPIPNFLGSYDGNGFKISDMNIDSNAQYQGLFGITTGATFRNIILEDVDLRMGGYSGALAGNSQDTNFSNITITGNIHATGLYVGGLVGQATPTESVISNCSVSGTMSSTSGQIGGLLGRGAVTINDCWTDLEMTIEGTRAGSLVSQSSGDMYINRCAVFGNITSSSTDANLYIGGIMGYAFLADIADSYVIGNVISTADGGRDYVGGLVGAKMARNCTIKRSYTTGNVIGRNYVGGLVGRIQTANVTGIEDCYALGIIAGEEHVGGLIGGNDSANLSVLHCYSTGQVFGDTNVGGLIGSGNGITTNSYWDTETSGQDVSPGGGVGRTTAEMTYPYADNNTYEDWDFEDVWKHDNDPSYNNGYPRLYYQEYPVEFIETPQLKVDIVQIDGEAHFRIRWELVEHARSYRIFASNDLSAADWGNPIRVVGEDVSIYTEPIGASLTRFFYIIASRETQ